MIEVWSGGQTGVDRAALDAALDLGLPVGGWIPRGRLAEDGQVPDRYPGLREAESSDYAVRTQRNVDETHGTLVLTWGSPAGGTLETIAIARRLARPLLEIDLATADLALAADAIGRWLAGLSQPGRPTRLNVAGPRASQAPQAYQRARRILQAVLGAAFSANLERST
jgi:hypothetical protein